MDGQWTTVGKKDTKKKDRKKGDPQKADAPSPPDAASQSAFASLDKNWKRQQDASRQTGTDPVPHVPSGSGMNGYAHSTDDSDASPSREPEVVKQKKPKAPKVKKPSPAALGAKLDCVQLRQVISSVEERYAADERVQLDLVADHFVTAFREADLPFNKLLTDQPLEKVTETPVEAVPAEVRSAMDEFVGRKDAQAVASFVSALIDSAFQGVPAAAGSSKAPAKANVGLLAVLALALRAKPAALVLAAQHLAAGGSRFSSTGRLPLLLWVFNQCARGSETAAVAVWVRVLLPQITGGPTAASAPSPAAAPAGVSGSKAAAVPPSAGASAQQQQKQQEQSLLSPASADKAFAYLDELLRSQEVKRGMVTGISVRDGELPLSLVPPSAVVAVAQAVHGQGATPVAADKLRSHRGILRTIALNGAEEGGFDAVELVKLAVDAAGAATGSSPSDPFIKEMSELVAAALLEDDAAGPAWQSKHKAGLRGSSRILAALDAGHPSTTMQLMAIKDKQTMFVALLGGLRGRHQYALRSGKGWQGSCARTADAAASSLVAKVQRDGGKTAMRSVVKTLAGGLGLSMILGGISGGAAGIFNHPLLQLIGKAAKATGLTAVALQVLAATEPYRQQVAASAAPYVQPAVDAATPYVQHASETISPLLQQASDAVHDASISLAWSIRNLTSTFTG
mmetsp:Transcript_6666/g.19195  ORF Transcript_6666/g.19195 Transcript_6666/m.19195 type:complete len:682 (-) Transcript_6666:259-2304(-)